MKYMFVSGSPASDDGSQAIATENKTYNDIWVVPDVTESYSNLPYQTMYAIEQYLKDDACEIIVKSDDDTYISPNRLAAFLSPLTKARTDPAIYGAFVAPGAPVHRQGKWRLTTEEYAPNTYPAYIQGPTYALTRAMAEIVHEDFKSLNRRARVRLEDINLALAVDRMARLQAKVQVAMATNGKVEGQNYFGVEASKEEVKLMQWLMQRSQAATPSPGGVSIQHPFTPIRLVEDVRFSPYYACVEGRLNQVVTPVNMLHYKGDAAVAFKDFWELEKDFYVDKETAIATFDHKSQVVKAAPAVFNKFCPVEHALLLKINLDQQLQATLNAITEVAARMLGQKCLLRTEAIWDYFGRSVGRSSLSFRDLFQLAGMKSCLTNRLLMVPLNKRSANGGGNNNNQKAEWMTIPQVMQSLVPVVRSLLEREQVVDRYREHPVLLPLPKELATGNPSPALFISKKVKDTTAIFLWIANKIHSIQTHRTALWDLYSIPQQPQQTNNDATKPTAVTNPPVGSITRLVDTLASLPGTPSTYPSSALTAHRAALFAPLLSWNDVRHKFLSQEVLTALDDFRTHAPQPDRDPAWVHLGQTPKIDTTSTSSSSNGVTIVAWDREMLQANHYPVSPEFVAARSQAPPSYSYVAAASSNNTGTAGNNGATANSSGGGGNVKVSRYNLSSELCPKLPFPCFYSGDRSLLPQAHVLLFAADQPFFTGLPALLPETIPFKEGGAMRVAFLREAMDRAGVVDFERYDARVTYEPPFSLSDLEAAARRAPNAHPEAVALIAYLTAARIPLILSSDSVVAPNTDSNLPASNAVTAGFVSQQHGVSMINTVSSSMPSTTAPPATVLAYLEESPSSLLVTARTAVMDRVARLDAALHDRTTEPQPELVEMSIESPSAAKNQQQQPNTPNSDAPPVVDTWGILNSVNGRRKTAPPESSTRVTPRFSFPARDVGYPEDISFVSRLCDVQTYQPGANPANDLRRLRSSFVKYLSQTAPDYGLSVASYGQCANNKKWPAGKEGDKTFVSSRHPFCLAIENSLAPWYHTEKLWDCLKSGAITIYFGNQFTANLVIPGGLRSVIMIPSLDEAGAKHVLNRIQWLTQEEIYDHLMHWILPPRPAANPGDAANSAAVSATNPVPGEFVQSTLLWSSWAAGSYSNEQALCRICRESMARVTEMQSNLKKTNKIAPPAEQKQPQKVVKKDEIRDEL